MNEHIKERLSLYIDNALSKEEITKIEKHLNECPQCKQELELLKKTNSIVTQWQAPSLDPDFEQQVKSKIFNWEMEKEAVKMEPKRKFIGVPVQVITAIVVVFFAIVSMQAYLKRAVQGRMREASDDIGSQYSFAPGRYEPYYMSTDMSVKEGGKKVQLAKREYDSFWSSRTGYQSVGRIKDSKITRSGRETYTAWNGLVSESGLRVTTPEFHTEEYDRIYENRFLEVAQNPLSTFSIDVDTASYSNMRRFINQDQLPPKDAVRIEELINYFTYDYPQPEGQVPFSVTMEATQCPWNTSRNLVLIGLQGKKMETEEMPPSNLVFLLDVSGSMNSSKKLPLVKSAFRLLVDNLRNEDRVAIVVYAGAAGLVLDSTSGYDKEKILEAIDELKAGGSTAGGAGVKLAYQIAKDNYIHEGNNRVILATDGDFNVGVSSNAELVRIIEKKREEGIFLTVLGFGTGNYKDSKMEQLADKGNGNYAYIDTILEAKKVFVYELGATLFTIAKDVKLQIEFNPTKIKAYRLIGYENRMLQKEDFNDDTKDAGELGAGHTVTALYEIVMADSDEEFTSVDPLKYQQTEIKESDELMTVKLRYKEPDADKSKLIVQTVTEKDIEKDDTSDNLKFASAVAEFGLLLRDSEHKGTASYQHVIKQANESKGKDKAGYRAEFIRLVEIAELLDRKK